MDVVTGGFSYTGRFIVQRLAAEERAIRTLTNHVRSDIPGTTTVETAPLRFDHSALVESLKGAHTLYNTYWIRFPRGGLTYDHAVANIRLMLAAARGAGIQRFVHISVTNPSLDSRFPYYRGKALAEEAVKESGLSYAIVRPTWIFGPGDILVNNVAWLLRRLPVFAIHGDGTYRVQPVAGEDVAEIAVHAAQATDNLVTDAAGPDILTYNQVVGLVREAVGSRSWILHVPPTIVNGLAAGLGRMLGDVLLTDYEAAGLMGELLVSNEPPAGRIRFADWVPAEGPNLGRTYASELARHFTGPG